MEELLMYGLLIIGGLCLLLALISNIRLHLIIKKYKKLIKGLSDKNVEDLMFKYSEELEALKEEVSINMHGRISGLEEKMPDCLRHIGMTTYNAFENMGNNMSFSVAALDDKLNGFVLTGIYTRDNSYVYAKEVEKGQPKKELSREEKEALSRAL